MISSHRPLFVLICLGMVIASQSAPREARGQWSSDAAANLVVGDGPSEQVQPKIAPTSDGGCYISWYDNSAGGYDVRLQRLNRKGFEQWAHNGTLIADRGFSSTVDYGLAVDASDHAILVFNDDRVSPVAVTAQKISPAGTLLWNGSAGVQVGQSGAPPSVAALSDGGYGVVFSNTLSPPSTIIQKLDANGAPLWGAGTVQSDPIVGTPRPFQPSDVQAGDAGSLIVLFVRCASGNCVTGARHLYAQKYLSNGTPMWGASTVAIHTSTSLTPAYFPRFLSDAAGGAVFGWYENGGSRNAYIQRVYGDGAVQFTTPVANTGSTPGRIRLSAGLAYNSATGEFYLASDEADSAGQTNHTVIVQKMIATNPPGNERQWGNGGITLIAPQGMFQSSFMQCQLLGDGVAVGWIWIDPTPQGYVYAAHVRVDMSIAWNQQICSSYTGQSRLASARSACGFPMFAFGHFPSGSVDIWAQNVLPSGRLGNPTLGDMNCDGAVNFLDVDPFAQALVDPAGYTAAHSCCDIENADMNADQSEDGLDVTGFVGAVLGP